MGRIGVTGDRFAPGARVGDYEIQLELGIEETGVVYLGKHVVLPRHAAIKVMHGGAEWVRAMAVQMLREACLVEALSHPGVPRVYECGVLADKRPWTAFEYIDGETISARMADGPLAVADVVVLVRDSADILDHLHRRGVVHRRLTAEAILRTEQRRFPIAIRHWGDACTTDHHKTHGPGMVDPRDDVHQLGVVAFRALTGAMPDDRSALERFPGAPRDVASLIDLMLSKDPNRRPTSAELRDRAKWLADTLELVPISDKPRWTPPHGLDPDSVPSTVQEVGSGFTIRIAGSRTRTR